MPDVMEMSKTRDQIERRAYEIYLARGCQGGQDIADWLTAEKELKQLAQAPLPEVTEVATTTPARVPKAKSMAVGHLEAAIS